MIKLTGLEVVRSLIYDAVSPEGLRQAFLTVLLVLVMWAAVYGLWMIPD